MQCPSLVAAALTSLVVPVVAQVQLPPVPSPAENPTTAAKANLGKALFWDEQLSSTRTVACGTCHAPSAGGGDPRASFSVNPGPDGQFGTADDIHGSPGVPLNAANGTYMMHATFGIDVQVTGRMAPTTINAAYNLEQFWDGREGGKFLDPVTGSVVLNQGGSLENQAMNPPTGDAEMASVGRSWVDCVNRIAASAPLALATNIPKELDQWIGTRSYPDLFQRVYGDSQITAPRILMAIAAYERTLISDRTPFDRGTMTQQQQQGLAIFNNKAGCNLCHEGVLFRDDTYHNIGLRPKSEDPGRFNVTGIPSDMGAFKTPGLRNVGLRTAFMHNGMHKSLADVIDFYDRGGDFFDNLDPRINPLGLTTQEKVALLDFLQNGLTDPRVRDGDPPFDPPALSTLSGRAAQSYGGGGAGSGGVEPRLIAIEPMVLGNPNYTMAMADGLGGAAGLLVLDTTQGNGQPVLGVPLLVAAAGTQVTLSLGPLQGSGSGQGYWSAPFGIPADNSLNGVSLFAQGFTIDSGAPQGLAGTAGLQLTFFAPR